MDKVERDWNYHCGWWMKQAFSFCLVHQADILCVVARRVNGETV